MNFAQYCQGIQTVVRNLAGIIQINNITSQTSQKTITWSGRKPGIMKGVYYPLEYQALIDTQQYSLLLKDGSFFQFFFDFDDSDILKKARLAYYPKPIPTSDSQDDIVVAYEDAIERSDEELFEHLYNWTELIDLHKHPSNTSHIRFDYDTSVESHCEAHIQLSGIQEFRVPASFIPQPMAFVQLCEDLVDGLESICSSTLTFERNHSAQVTDPEHLIKLKLL